jgi:NADH:ubiquinone oxidoreductase subunit 6 (subunit J)
VITLGIFILFAVLAATSAVLVVVQRNVMHSVLYLAFTVLSVSGVFFTLQAEYLGAIQILVYGGGIVVLYIFVIIIVNLKEVVPERRKLFPKLFIIAAPALLLAEIAFVLLSGPYRVAAVRGEGGELPALARMLLTTYLVPFELASILLLAVLVGAIIVARGRNLRDSR